MLDYSLFREQMINLINCPPSKRRIQKWGYCLFSNFSPHGQNLISEKSNFLLYKWTSRGLKECKCVVDFRLFSILNVHTTHFWKCSGGCRKRGTRTPVQFLFIFVQFSAITIFNFPRSIFCESCVFFSIFVCLCGNYYILYILSLF